MDTGDLFASVVGKGAAEAPLAERMRPESLEDYVGQRAFAPGGALRRALDAPRLPSLILFGPPGSGKTTLARLLGKKAGVPFEVFSAVTSGVADVREVVKIARRRLANGNVATVLFVDEIHRFNRAQQDAFLPHVEDGTIILIGSTTENPSFHLNPALLSRCLVVPLEPLSVASLTAIAERALRNETRGLASLGVTLSKEAMELLARSSHGDARALLNRLESAVRAAVSDGMVGELSVEALEQRLVQKPAAHDRSGDLHYDLASAYQKSLRGSDPEAALYWLARMLEGGEDPLFILRRLVVTASEDVGLADPWALQQTTAALDAYRFLGSPEGLFAVAQATVYVATAPKSNRVYAALGAARDAVRSGSQPPVPDHLKNASAPLNKRLLHGANYRYPHDFPGGLVRQRYLPESLVGVRFYVPTAEGHEARIMARMAEWQRRLAEGE